MVVACIYRLSLGYYFYMYGGNITGNTTEKEGGGVYAVSDITVSGNVNITGNKKADGV